MSKRNSQEAKRAARERLRIEREKQAKKERMRRQLVVGGSIVGVLAIAAGVGVAVANMNSGGEGDSSNWSAAKKVATKGAGGTATVDGEKLSYAAPANTSGKNGTDIVIGDKDAQHTLEIYEDMRCPVCAAFEQNTGDVVLKDIEKGKYKASFTFGTFLDGDTDEELSSNGTGSKNALSALGAALNVSPDAFLEYKKVLFSKEDHPAETDDAFADDQHLIDLAQKVDELKGDKKFEKAVKQGTYDSWALNVSQKFRDSGVQGTPTFKLDGTHLKANAQGSPPMTPEQFNTLVDQEIAKSGGKDGGGDEQSDKKEGRPKE
ncbi:thioredoxin domain-containing protein [Streptomyces sp. JJ36]|uniref:thioredoxin domain-containing protein n=1 Tax=Streptomyces sp. JJ36 TaxID=2736645 RepID=UPI001F16EBF8|nr:thioredoxin domain-containing protein [Streptomyces sp. JJ36]MCF6526316.1 thioredoxin domain-containing protein [Streptomyces sp. JJ36]